VEKGDPEGLREGGSGGREILRELDSSEERLTVGGEGREGHGGVRRSFWNLTELLRATDLHAHNASRMRNHFHV
jgi:hypothetical protein